MTAAAAAGGMGLDTATAAAIYGMYTSLVYLMSVPGGWLADRVLGQRKAVLYGGILIAARPLLAGRAASTIVLPRAVLIVLGTGLLKPNISVIVGQLYGQTGRPPRRGVLDLLHGDQPRRVPRAAHHRLPGAGRALPRADRGLGHGSELGVALGVRRGRRRHDARPDSVRRSAGKRARHGGARAGRRDDAASCAAKFKRQAIATSGMALGALVVARGAARAGRRRHDSRRRTVRDVTGYSLLVITVAFFGSLFLDQELDAATSAAACT